MKTDSQLQSDVLHELNWRPSVNAAHIGVTANNGVVTLSGQVHHYTQKMNAEETAKRVSGVVALANDIEVEAPGSTKHSDQDIAEAALAAIKWDFEVPKDKLTLTVKKGWVTLEGVVDWQYQKEAAARCVRYLLGVIAVTNLITIKPNVTWIDVKGKIENAFLRVIKARPEHITVNTHDDGTVMLSGAVASWSEREMAVAAAWAAPGVTSVIDDLVVAH